MMEVQPQTAGLNATTYTMSERVCLKWNEFQENLNSAFGSLRGSDAFTDVTLACVDGKLLEAHRIILATSSPVFKELLGKSKHPHPIVYMRGMISDDLVAILDFLYFGETNVHKENLDKFFAIAEEFQLEGLTGDPTERKIMQATNEVKIEEKSHFENPTLIKVESKPKMARNATIQRYTFSEFKDLDEKVYSMMEKSGNFLPNGSRRKAYICKTCGKEGMGNDIKKHIEANHLEGIVLPCKHCEKTFRCRNSFTSHMRNQHQE